MTLTYRSSIPQSFTLIGRDPDGRQRSVTASKGSQDFYWNLHLRHPSGRNWQAQYRGEGVLDAMSELLNSKDAEFKLDKARGDRPHEEPLDRNRSVDGYAPPISAFIWKTRSGPIKTWETWSVKVPGSRMFSRISRWSDQPMRRYSSKVKRVRGRNWWRALSIN